MTAEDVVRTFAEPVEEVTLLLNHNLHSAYLFHKDSWFRDLYSSAARVVVDGWPVLRLMKGPRDPQFRIGSTDWIATLCGSESARAHRVFLLGGDPEANLRAREHFTRMMPSATVAGRDGYFDLKVDAAAISARITEFRPTLVLVGMGMPRQERFLAEQWDDLPPAHYATVGGAIDYVAQRAPLAPRFLGRLGLEWFWRFVHDPRRLFERYFIEPLKLLVVLMRPSPWNRPRPGEEEA